VEGVAERVELCDGDARRLPFGDQTFDVVVSSLALHNIPGAAGRAAAIDEPPSSSPHMNGESPASRPGSEGRWGMDQVMNSLSSVTTLRLGMAPMRRFFSTPPMNRARVGMLITP
jgi:hypothetical protein